MLYLQPETEAPGANIAARAGRAGTRGCEFIPNQRGPSSIMHTDGIWITDKREVTVPMSTLGWGWTGKKPG